MDRMAIEMNKLSPFLKARVVLGGSANENTKMGLPDEFDYRLYLGGLDGFCSVVKELGFDEKVLSWHKGSVHLMISEAADTAWLAFCDENRCLDSAQLFQHLHCKMYKALTSLEVWKGLDMYWKPHGCNAVNIQWMGKNHIYIMEWPSK